MENVSQGKSWRQIAILELNEANLQRNIPQL
jgi:hypothetical protein